MEQGLFGGSFFGFSPPAKTLRVFQYFAPFLAAVVPRLTRGIFLYCFNIRLGDGRIFSFQADKTAAFLLRKCPWPIFAAHQLSSAGDFYPLGNAFFMFSLVFLFGDGNVKSAPPYLGSLIIL